MATIYETSRGPSQEPIRAEVWSHTGQLEGVISNFESMTFNFSDRSADTAEIVAALDPITAKLLTCDGTSVIAMKIGGKTHLTVPVKAAAVSGDTPEVGLIKVTAAGGMAMLDGELNTPAPDRPLEEVASTEYSFTGPLESVIKSLIYYGSNFVGHPVYILPIYGRGPTVTITGSWDTVGERIKELLAYSGYRLDVRGWVPGDPVPYAAYSPTAPCYFVELVPYGQDGPHWSVAGGDVTDWSVEYTRAQATEVVVAYTPEGGGGGEDHNVADTLPTLRRYFGPTPASPLAARQAFVKYDAKGLDIGNGIDPYRLAEGMEAVGRQELAAKAQGMEVSITLDVTQSWDFGVDRAVPNQFDVGDRARVDLPVLGEIDQLITDVEVSITPEVFKVVPKIAAPDTLDTSIFGTLAAVATRVSKLERT